VRKIKKISPLKSSRKAIDPLLPITKIVYGIEEELLWGESIIDFSGREEQFWHSLKVQISRI